VLIPSIDLSDGRIVQLVQGERLAIATGDIDLWIGRLRRYRLVQLIDLDAARGLGTNEALAARVLRELPCRVGGGVRTTSQARALIEVGAREVIVGSALFPDGQPDPSAAERFAAAIGRERLFAAVDSRSGRIVVRGWREQVDIPTVDAVRALDPAVGGFLYTHVDTEGLMQGIDMAAVERVRAAATGRLAAAGGIATLDEVKRLDAMKVDAVVGMALYTGRLNVFEQ
jgi:phosphoribosylformimino-5-aminoimidazole carboxamide ribotide isomerase